MKSEMSLSYGALEAAEEDSTIFFPASPDVKNAGNEKRTRLLPTLIGTITVLLMATGLIVMADVFKTPISSGELNSFSLVASDALAISSVSNDYGVRDSSSMLPYTFLVDSFLIEPYKEATIALADSYKGCAYDWSFKTKNEGVVTASGRSTDGNILVTLTAVGEYTFTIAEECGDLNTSKRQLDMSVWVKYVRRELSALNDQDREDFLDAFHTLWTVSTTQGKLLYGERYKSVNYFAALHNDGGGNPVCDEFHGGLGFLNNHMYLSAYLEQSLQLVNPKVALHYLEYNQYFESQSYQSHLDYQLDGGKWTEILSSKYFGSNDPVSGVIIDGRWAGQAMPYVTEAFFKEEGIEPDDTFFPPDQEAWLRKSNPHLNSPYGLLRSPWNYNPVPLVTRYGSVFGINNTKIIGDNRDVVFKYHMGVRCSDYEQFFLNVKNQPLQSYLSEIEDNTHGIFHFTFGGVGGAHAEESVATLINDYGFSYSNIAAVAVSAQPFFKKYLAVNKKQPVNCTDKPWQNFTMLTTALPAEIDGPSCDFADFYYDDEDSLSGLLAFFFNVDPDTDDSVVSHLMSLEFETRKEAMKVIGNMFPYDGDLAGSGAALDPLFWVAHGAMERTFQRTVFSGLFSDMLYNNTDHCSGHDSNTGKYWLKGYYFVNETIATEDVSNADLTAILDPTSDQYRDLINFVYDTSTFEWCDGSEAWFE